MIKLLLSEIKKHIQSLMSPINKQVWNNIAASMNTYGYNLSSENCNIKWTGLKKKFKTIKDARNKTGTAKQIWEYYDIINEMLSKKPEIEPLSLASNSRGFQLNRVASNTFESINIETNFNNNNKENEENVHIESSFEQNRITRKRKSQTPAWVERLIEQRQKHYENNYAQRERFLLLLEKYLNK